MSKRSPSADDDYHDRFQATKSRKWSSNKGGGGGSIQSNKYTNISAHGDSIKEALEIQCLGLGRGEVPYVSPSTDEDDGDRTKQAKLPAASPAARPAVLLTDTVMEIIHLVSQQSNALEKPTIAELEIMLHAMSNMHEPSVVQGSDEADNHLVEMIRGKLIVEQLHHSSDRPFGNSRQTTNGIGMGNSWVPSTNKHVVKTEEEMLTDYPVRREDTFRHGYISNKDDEKVRLAWSCAIKSRILLAYAAGEDDPTPLVADIFPAHKRIGYDKETAVIMDDDNRDIAICILTHTLNTCRAMFIQEYDGKNILPSVFRSMGLVGVVLYQNRIGKEA